MRLDILETLNSALGSPLIRQIGSSLGESEDSTRTAVRSAGPTMLAALMQQAATPSGASNLYRIAEDDRIDPGIVGKLSGMLGNKGSLDAVSSLGESIGKNLFGDRQGAVSNAIASVSGINQGSALRLLSMGLPLVFGILKKYMGQNRTDAGGLASLLLGQRSSLEKAGLDSRITNALGHSSLSSMLGALPASERPAETAYQSASYREAPRATTATTTHKRDKPWLPWAIAAGIAALALLIWSGNRNVDDRASVPPVATTTPDSTAPATTESAPAPTRLASASTQVYFDRGGTEISAEDRQKIASVAETVRDQNRPVAITGYTDRTGDPNQNLEIAKSRAGVVRDALVAEGVNESQIVMDPPAVVTGSGTDAEARRVDIEAR